MPGTGSPVTLSLLAERLGTAQQGIDQIQKDLKTVNEQALDRRVSKLEDTVRWLTRTVAAALISGVGAVIVALVVNK
jgi:hypothetical protein